MGRVWTDSLATRYDSVIDGLERVIRDCPDDLWERSVWKVRKTDPYVWPVRRVDGSDEGEHLLQVVSAFWNVAYHALFFLDCYLDGGRDDYAPPDPFRADDQEGHVVPSRTYTRDELLAFLAHGRQEARSVLDALTEAEAERPARGGRPFASLLLGNLLHVQEHTVQLRSALDRHRDMAAG